VLAHIYSIVSVHRTVLKILKCPYFKQIRTHHRTYQSNSSKSVVVASFRGSPQAFAVERLTADSSIQS
jgi:hypothetical protein